jgi:MFS family permease
VGRIRQSAQAFRAVFGNRPLRRIQLAWACSMFGNGAYAIAIIVYAYQHDGATAVGIVALLRWVGVALASPFGALLGDRYDRRWVMAGSTLVRGGLIGAAAIVAATSGPSLLVYAIAVMVAIATAPFRPAQAAVIPTLARTPEELTASNVVASAVENVGLFGGPALGGILLATWGPSTVFGVTFAMLLFAALLVALIPAVPVQARREHEPVIEELLAGVRVIRGERRLRVLVGLFSVQLFVDGMLTVMLVVVALKLLGMGRGGVGYLNAAIGIGGVVGAFAAAALVGRRRLAGDFSVGLLLASVPIALVAAWPHKAFAIAILALGGVGGTLVEVSGMTLIQRAAPEAVASRVFGALESLLFLAIGLGALAAPGLLSLLGTRGALLVAGLLAPVLVLPAWRALGAIDRTADVPTHRLDLLRNLPIFAPLAPATLERLASELVEVRVPADRTIFRQGDEGDLFYVVDEGAVEVLADRAEPVVLEHGDFFGEIALLRDVPRTASVRARIDTRLYALGRDAFIPAVTGYAPSREAAENVIGMRLGQAGLVQV